MGGRRPVIQNMTNHLDTCETGTEDSCPDCVVAGIIQRDECDTCGASRWVHRCGPQLVYNPVSGQIVSDTYEVQVVIYAHATSEAEAVKIAMAKIAERTTPEAWGDDLVIEKVDA